MNTDHKNPREMSNDETAKWMQELMESQADEKGSTGGACSFEAVKHPIRRKILGILEEKPLEISDIADKLEVVESQLKFHLNVLNNAYFIEIKGDMADLTPGGVSFVRNSKGSS